MAPAKLGYPATVREFLSGRSGYPGLRHTAARAIAMAVATGLVVPPGSWSQAAAAAPTEKAPELGPADEAALAESRALYEEGKAKFDTVDYAGAIDLWTKAYAKIPEAVPGVRNAMVYNIATAREKAYELDGDTQHLRQAIMLLQSYVKSYKELYARTPETQIEVEKAEERITDLEARLAAAERGDAGSWDDGGNQAAGTLERSNHAIMWNTGHNPPPDPELLERNRRLAQEGKKTDAMLISGYVVGSFGLLLLLASGSAFGVGFAQASGSDEENAGRGGKMTGFVTLGLGLGAVAAGATLLGVGFSRRKKHQRGELAVSPVVSPHFTGASVLVRF